ncbi:MAG: hypothetical protein OEY94_08750 [Alphaproteobacteria bacterium]|nr:hypothetical protein [Alphaproteobacteria bacterium]
MAIDYKIANHNCNIVRRILNPVMPDLTLFFIIHGEDERSKQFSKNIHYIREHPCGELVVEYIKNNPEILTYNRTSFCGLSRANSSGFLGFLKSESSIALCFMNQDRFETEEYFKNHAFHIAWHAYALLRDVKKEDVSLYKFSEPNNKKSFILPSLEIEELRHRNLVADIFSASIQYLMGKENALDVMAQQRLDGTVKKDIGFISENFPFIIALDTLDHALKSDKVEKEKKKGNSAKNAIDIALSTAKTYTAQSTTQWSGFSYPAQHMAWCGFEPEKILGAAIYTNENTYIHSIADTVAERLNIKPEMISKFQDFNPFTEYEANNRLHSKFTETVFDKIINKIRTPKEYMVLLAEARTQNNKLLEGNPIGWCAHSIIVVSQTFEASQAETFDEAILSRSKELFNEEQLTIDFQILWNFSQTIFEFLRTGNKIDAACIEKINESYPEFGSICRAISYINNMSDQIDEAKKKQKTGIYSFISSNTLKK